MNNGYQGGPDYYYRWNGEGGNQGGGNKKSPVWKVLLIVLIVVSVILTILGAAYLSAHPLTLEGLISDNSSESSDNSSASDKDVSRPEYTPPVFVIGSDEADYSTELTEIYDKCSVSCCTVRVSYSYQSGYAIGSGFVFDSENGYIATNHHVIEDAADIRVIFYNGEEYTAQLVGSDSVTDLAVLQIEADNLVAMKLGNSSTLKVGETAIAIGTPYDEAFAGTMTCGIISGIARNVEIPNDRGVIVKKMTLIQTDCTINPGNSGGPLLNAAGYVVGINSLKIVESSFENIGFAIPITEAAEIFQKLIAGEEIGDTTLASATAKIGIQVSSVDYGLSAKRIRPSCDYPKDGIFVLGFTSRNTAAEKAGLRIYDIITEFNGKPVANNEELGDILSECRAGQEVTIKVFRFGRNYASGETIEITFKLDQAS